MLTRSMMSLVERTMAEVGTSHPPAIGSVERLRIMRPAESPSGLNKARKGFVSLLGARAEQLKAVQDTFTKTSK